MCVYVSSICVCVCIYAYIYKSVCAWFMLGHIVIVSKCVCVSVCGGKFDHWLCHRHFYDWSFQKEIISVVATMELICSDLLRSPVLGTCHSDHGSPQGPGFSCHIFESIMSGQGSGAAPNKWQSTTGSVGVRFPRCLYWASVALKLPADRRSDWLELRQHCAVAQASSCPALPSLHPLLDLQTTAERMWKSLPHNSKDLPWPSCLPGPLASLSTASRCKEGLMSLWERSGERHC